MAEAKSLLLREDTDIMHTQGASIYDVLTFSGHWIERHPFAGKSFESVPYENILSPYPVDTGTLS